MPGKKALITKLSKQIHFSTTNKLRLDEFLRLELPAEISKQKNEISTANEVSISNSKIRRLILSGNVFVNGRECRRPAFELRGKSEIAVDFDSEKFFYEKQPDDIAFTVTDESVLFEDDNLIFINKPAFFPVEQTITGNRANLHDAVVDYLWKRNPELRNPPYVGIMHRLDKETSGVILFTKNRPINKPVSEMFQSHNFTKKYVAIVVISEAAASKKNLYKPGYKFTVEKYMGRISGKSKEGKWGSLSEKNGGQYSKTDFEILSEVKLEGKKCLAVSCSLYTGRTHQIRVHLSEAGLPLLGDTLYGGPEAKRIHLHATQLACQNENLNFDVRSTPVW